MVVVHLQMCFSHCVDLLSEETSELGRYRLEALIPAQKSLSSPSPKVAKINLVKRMLHKTKHIRRQNGRQGKKQKGKGVDPQISTTLHPRSLQSATIDDGKEEQNQAPSLASPNNFINFCLSSFAAVEGAVIMNGTQTGRKAVCNGIPSGMAPGQDHLPSCKFISPKNLDTVKANETFRVTLAIRNLVVGVFTNPKKTFMSAPAQLDPESGDILGHSHIVIQALDRLDSTVVPDPLAFFFFKGVDEAAKDGTVSIEVKDGLPPGFWRFSTINTASNHQPIGATLAQHSIFDDVIYVTSK